MTAIHVPSDVVQTILHRMMAIHVREGGKDIGLCAPVLGSQSRARMSHIAMF